MDLLILKGLKSFIFNIIRNCSQVLNLKDLKSFAVYEFRGLHKNGAIGGIAESKFLATDAHGLTGMRRVEVASPGRNWSKCCSELTQHASTRISKCQLF